MVKINIIGWYGTETIGDRAILAGLFRLFAEVYGDFHVRLGSLNPFFSDRCYLEDREYYNSITAGHLKELKTYNTMRQKDIKRNVQGCDYVFFGGGPFMDISVLDNMLYAFRYAKKKGLKTGILGCGYGPISNPHLMNSVKKLVQKSDVVIFRDEISRIEFSKIYEDEKVVSLIDPATFCAQYAYELLKAETRTGHYVAVNLRDVSLDSYDNTLSDQYEKLFISIISKEISEGTQQIQMVPMHTYHIGGDDREYLYRMAEKFDEDVVMVHSRPLSLFDTMKVYYHARKCYGMRFHSVVLQTLLNGNNIILDYTHPTKGKTIGFIRQLGLEEKYKDSYVSLCSGDFYNSISVPQQSPIDYTEIERCYGLYKAELMKLQ